MKPYKSYSPESLKKCIQSANMQANRKFRKTAKLTRIVEEEYENHQDDKVKVSY